jgi:DNA-binding transcriptional MocR family regulator
MLPQAMQAAVTYVAGRAFFVDGSGAGTLRLCFSQPTPERIREGVARLANVIRAALETQSSASADSGISVPNG